MEKLVDVATYIHQEFVEAFGSNGMGVEDRDDLCSKIHYHFCLLIGKSSLWQALLHLAVAMTPENITMLKG